MKKPTGSFRFYKPETEKTELNPNRKKWKKTEPNRKKLSQTGKTESNRFYPKNQTKTGQFEPVSVRFRFFLKKFGLITFLYKNQTELKIITPINNPP